MLSVVLLAAERKVGGARQYGDKDLHPGRKRKREICIEKETREGQARYILIQPTHERDVVFRDVYIYVCIRMYTETDRLGLSTREWHAALRGYVSWRLNSKDRAGRLAVFHSFVKVIC